VNLVRRRLAGQFVNDRGRRDNKFVQDGQNLDLSDHDQITERTCIRNHDHLFQRFRIGMATAQKHFTVSALAPEVVNSVVVINAASLQNAIRFIAADSRNLCGLMVGETAFPATFGYESLKRRAGKITALTQSPTDLVGQFQCDLHVPI
jgi:hypothetical protein